MTTFIIGWLYLMGLVAMRTIVVEVIRDEYAGQMTLTRKIAAIVVVLLWPIGITLALLSAVKRVFSP